MADKQWTQEDTKKFCLTVQEMYDKALDEYGDQIADQLAYVISCMHPEHAVDGEFSAAALARVGRNENILRIAALIIKSCAHDLAAHSGAPYDMAKAKIVKEVMREADKDHVRAGDGYESEFPGSFKKKD